MLCVYVVHVAYVVVVQPHFETLLDKFLRFDSVLKVLPNLMVCDCSLAGVA